MSLSKTLKIGFISRTAFPERNIEIHLRNRMNVYEQIVFLFLKSMHSSYEIFISDTGGIYSNGSWTGLIGMLNRSEIDIAISNFYMSEDRYEAVHFAYPFNLGELTFVTRNSQYSPKMFAVFSTISVSVWIALAIFIMVVTLTSLLIYNHYSFDVVVLNIVAVCLNQPMCIILSRLSEKLLIYFFMLGIMFFALCYKSVLLSFLSLPPLAGVSTVKELAKAVEEGDYRCMIYEGTSFPVFFSRSNELPLRIIGGNILQNPFSYGTIEHFFRLTSENIAYIEIRERATFVKDKYFISEDRFLQYMQGMATTKHFCCKKQLNSGLHRLLAGGFHQKFTSERNFRKAFLVFSSENVEVGKRRKISFTDVSSAFVFLFSGYFISILVLIVEIMFYR